MICLLRVDHRLLHGQVAFSWTNSVQANCILVANDKVLNDEIWKTTLRLGKPSGVKLVIKGVDDAIKAINSGVTDKYRLIVVVRDVEDAYRLAMGCPSIKSINLGGTLNGDDKRPISKQIFVTEHEIQELNELMEKGVEVEVRQLANEKKEILQQPIQ